MIDIATVVCTVCNTCIVFEGHALLRIHTFPPTHFMPPVPLSDHSAERVEGGDRENSGRKETFSIPKGGHCNPGTCMDK